MASQDTSISKFDSLLFRVQNVFQVTSFHARVFQGRWRTQQITSLPPRIKHSSQVIKWAAAVNAKEIEALCIRMLMIPISPIAGITRATDGMASKSMVCSCFPSRGEQRKSTANSMMLIPMLFFPLATYMCWMNWFGRAQSMHYLKTVLIYAGVCCVVRLSFYAIYGHSERQHCY